MKIDWKKKLSSRKFWMAIVGFITPLLIAFGVSESAATEFAGIIVSGASCIAYIVGEGLVDSERASKSEQSATTNITKTE